MISENINRESPIPAYHQIAVDMRRRISSSEWEINQKIPSEFDLADQYNVSRITLRQALAELEKDGLIKKIRGKGVFINAYPAPIVHDLSFPSILGPRLGQTGVGITPEVLTLEYLETPFQDLYDSLEITSSDPIVYIKRLFTFNGRAVAINQSWFSSALVPNLVELGLENNSLTSTLKNRYGLQTNTIFNSLEAMRPSPSDVTLLDINYNVPVISLKSISYTENNRPLEYSLTTWVGDYIRFNFKVTNTDHGLMLHNT